MACGRTIRNFGLDLGRRLSLFFWAYTQAVAGLLVLLTALVVPSLAAPLKTTVAASETDGYARLVFTASEYLDATARIAGSVLIISFSQPVDVSVDRVAEQVADYIGAARRDPDGKNIRVALAQPVTVNTMSAGEKVFVDLLPQSWTGLPPSLPQDVVNDLAKRAHIAELQVQHDHQMEKTKPIPLVSVRVAKQPTFTRYIFAVSAQTPVAPDRSSKDRLILNFDTPLTFDLADADAALPDGVKEITSELDNETSLVRFIFGAKLDVRTFRDETGYVVDVGNPANPAAAGKPGAAAAQSDPVAKAVSGVAAALAVAGEGGHAMSGAAPAAASSAPPDVEAPATIPAPSPQATPIAQPAQVPQPAPAPVAAPAPQPAPQPGPQPSANSIPPVTPVAPSNPPAPPKTESQNAAPAALPAVADNAVPTPAATPAQASTPAVAAAPVQAAPAQSASAPTESAPAQPAAKPADPNKLAVELAHQGANLKLSFPFKVPAAAAVFHRADTLWIVFDSKVQIDLSALDGEPSRTIRSYDVTQSDGADVIRLKLDRPHLSSVAADGSGWTVEIGDSMLEPSRALDITRNVIGPNRSNITVPFEQPQQVHRLTDPEVGDTLYVVTGFAPARGFVNAQEFIEFNALASTEGVVIEPIADDVTVGLAPDKVVVGRPNGLTLSTSLQTLLHGSGLRPVMFDSQIWGFDRDASYIERQSHLIAAAAAAPENQRLSPRLDLARFYLARDMYPEAKGVLDVALSDQRAASETISAMVLRAVAEVMMNRPETALKDLSDPAVGDQHDAPLWRALAYARQGKWSEARGAFRSMDATVATLPAELQRVALGDEMRSAIEVGDFDAASTQLNDFETIGVPHDMEPVIAVLMGRLAEGMGRNEDALSAYRTAADSWDRPAAAQGVLRETMLRYKLGDLKRDEVINQLETLTTIWRGDETEIEALKVLAHLYTEDGRYREAFYVMRSAMAAHPGSELTRQIQDEAAQTFDSLFLAGKGDAMPAIDALALFYDFRELTPIGSRGDEMIRRLADRLVSVDLLDQAADLLQYQVDHRLEGAARAQVATRLAVVYLMNRKADRALAALRGTRVSDLSNELRNQRLLLESRALSDLGRHDVALEVIANIDGPQAIRLRSDILWSARRWDDSAEQIELMYGDCYKDFQPLSDIERQDILRAEIGYALAEDTLGLGRFRDKYAAKMAATPDARAFEIVSAPLGTSGEEFGAIAHAAASVDTLESFLHDMKARYPDSAAAVAPTVSPAAGQGVSAQPPNSASPSAAAQPPATTEPAASNAAPVLPPDLAPAPPARAAGHTAQR
jgi:tetratricopeptide (TPR) repeat protein